MRKRLFSSRLFKMKRGQLLLSRTLALHFKMISQQHRRFYKRPLLPPGTCRGRPRSAAGPRDPRRPRPPTQRRCSSSGAGGSHGRYRACARGRSGSVPAAAPPPASPSGGARPFEPRREGVCRGPGRAAAVGRGGAGRGARGPPVLLPGGGSRCSGPGPGAACGGAGLPGFGLPALGGLLREGNGSAEGKVKV